MSLWLNLKSAFHTNTLEPTQLISYPRPLVWSEASVIFSAHPTRPEVTGRHFASSKQFSVPPPAVINSSPSLYNSPTFISVAPGDKYLFVFYPAKSSEGIGCIWRRGPRLDTWVVLESWKFSGVTCPVAAEWLGCPRTVSIDVATLQSGI